MYFLIKDSLEEVGLETFKRDTSQYVAIMTPDDWNVFCTIFWTRL